MKHQDDARRRGFAYNVMLLCGWRLSLDDDFCLDSSAVDSLTSNIDSLTMITQVVLSISKRVITLRASCRAVYCNRSCLFVGGWVGGWMCVCVWGVGLLLEIACIDPHQTGFVCKR